MELQEPESELSGVYFSDFLIKGKEMEFESEGNSSIRV